MGKRKIKIGLWKTLSLRLTQDCQLVEDCLKLTIYDHAIHNL